MIKSLLLLNIVTERIGLTIKRIVLLLYADDIVLLSDTEEGLQKTFGQSLPVEFEMEN